MITHLAISAIRTDGGTQSRTSLDDDYIADLAQVLFEGDTFKDPVIVYYDDTDYWLADGFHRLHASIIQCRDTIEADVRPGSQRDAILHSVGANATHGLRRTNEDKHRSVETLLKDPEWVKWNDNEIARRCGVAQSFVWKIRQDVSYLKDKIGTLQERYVQRNGTTYTMNTSNIGHQPDALLQDRAEEEDEEDFSSRYDHTKSAYCKYCYETHDDWKLGGDYGHETVWECQKCDHATHDDFMQIEDVELSPQQKAFYAKYTYIDEGLSELVPVEEPAYGQYLEGVNRQEPSRILSPDDLPASFGLVNGKPFTVPLQDGKERRDAHVMQVMGSSDSPEWYTPRFIIDLTCQLMGEIELDPCSNGEKNVPACRHYTLEDDGLMQHWQGKTYLNPPYGSEVGRWVNKLVDEYEAGNVTESVSLLPGRIDTMWFQPLYKYLFCHIKGRVQFENSPYSAPFPCVIVYMGKNEEGFTSVFGKIGPIMEKRGR